MSRKTTHLSGLENPKIGSEAFKRQQRRGGWEKLRKELGREPTRMDRRIAWMKSRREKVLLELKYGKLRG